MFMPILNEAGVDVMVCGHLHRHLFVRPGKESGAKFPVIINSNVDVIEASADDHSLELSVKNGNGQEILHHTVKR